MTSRYDKLSLSLVISKFIVVMEQSKGYRKIKEMISSLEHMKISSLDATQIKEVLLSSPFPLSYPLLTSNRSKTS